MLRTKEEIDKTALTGNWGDVKNLTISRLKVTFQEHPDYFFTEHDIHSVLYNITKEELQLNRIPSEKTCDGHQVLLVHHEYPTPFRCDMKKHGFQIKHEPPYIRGHYDLVILNPKFVQNYKLDVVCGKDYQRFRLAMEEVEVEPLIWVCEVIFFPRVKRLPKNALKVIEQDALKVKETLRCRVGRNVNFCNMGTVLVFTNHTNEETYDLKQQILDLRRKHNLEVILSTISAKVEKSSSHFVEAPQAKLSYLKRVTNPLQAYLIMTPWNKIVSFDLDEDAQIAFLRMSNPSENIDYAPIMKEGAIIGYVCRKDLAGVKGKICEELVRDVAAKNRISLTLSLENILKRLTDEPFLFVGEDGRPRGIITRADVNKRAFRTLFYIAFSELESQLVNLIQTMLPCEKHLRLLSEERAKDVLYNYWRAKTGNVETSVEQYLSFSDIIHIILKSKDMLVWSLLGYTSKKQVENLTSLIDLRNRVMHSTRSLLTAESSVLSLLQQYEQIWELLENLEEFESLDENDIVSVTYDRKNQDFRFVLKSGAVIRTPLDDINGKELETVGIEKIRKFLGSSSRRNKMDKATMRQLRSTVIFSVLKNDLKMKLQ